MKSFNKIEDKMRRLDSDQSMDPPSFIWDNIEEKLDEDKKLMPWKSIVLLLLLLGSFGLGVMFYMSDNITKRNINNEYKTVSDNSATQILTNDSSEKSSNNSFNESLIDQLENSSNDSTKNNITNTSQSNKISNSEANEKLEFYTSKGDFLESSQNSKVLNASDSRKENTERLNYSDIKGVDFNTNTDKDNVRSDSKYFVHNNDNSGDSFNAFNDMVKSKEETMNEDNTKVSSEGDAVQDLQLPFIELNNSPSLERVQVGLETERIMLSKLFLDDFEIKVKKPRKFNFALDYSPNFSNISNSLTREVADSDKFSFNTFFKVYYNISKNLSVNSGLGYFNMGTFDVFENYREIVIENEVFEVLDKYTFIYDYNYIAIPLGIEYRYASLFIRPEINLAFNLSNKITTIKEIHNEEIETSEIDATLNVGSFNKLLLPLSVTIGNTFKVYNLDVSLGVKGYYSWNQVVLDVPRINRSYGLGLYAEIQI